MNHIWTQFIDDIKYRYRRLKVERIYANFSYPRFFNRVIKSKLREIYVYSSMPLRRYRDPNGKFIIFCLPRSGSNLLQGLLNTHDQVKCEGEVMSERLWRPSLFINEIAKSAYPKVYGCRIFMQHIIDQNLLNHTNFLRQKVDEGWKIIYLRREDMLRQNISLCIAAKTGRWVRFKGDAHKKQIDKVTIDPKFLLSSIRYTYKCQSGQKEYLKGIPYLEIIYEKDLKDEQAQQKTMIQVCKFLDIPLQSGITPKTKKQTPDNLREIVENYDEVMACLESSEYRNKLDGILRSYAGNT